MEKDVETLRNIRESAQSTPELKLARSKEEKKDFVGDNEEILTTNWKKAMQEYISQNSGSCYLP